MLIRELLNIESLQPIVAQTGEAGLEKPLKDVVLLEYDSLQQPRPKDYYLGDFIISTLYFVKDDPEALYRVVGQLIQLGAAGLAYKSVYYQDFPEPALELARSHSFPILRFEGLYIEDVILTISDNMRLRQEFSMYEEPLFKILQGTAEGYGIEHLCAQMNPNRKKYMCAAYVHSENMTSDWSAGLRNVLQLRSSRRITSSYRFLQFRRGFFVLLNYTQPVPVKSVGKELLELFSGLGMDLPELHFGVGTLQQRSTDFDRVIRDAFDALLYSLRSGRQLSTMEDLRLYQCIFPLVRDKTTRAVMHHMMEVLEAYDRESSSGCLLATLEVYARNGYSIPDTAEEMQQHPNTIRYRLKKICELTSTEAEVNHALFLLGEFLKMDTLSSSIF